MKYDQSKIRREFLKKVKEAVADACGNCYARRLHQDWTIQQTIDEKNQDVTDNERFQLYVCAVDDIINNVKEICPFIDLEGINLSWKIKDIIDMVVIAYYNIPPLKLNEIIEIQQKIKEAERIAKQEAKSKKTSK